MTDHHVPAPDVPPIPAAPRLNGQWRTTVRTSLAAAALLGWRLIWLANKFARHPEDRRGWLSLFLFSNLYLLILFLVLVVERLARFALG